MRKSLQMEAAGAKDGDTQVCAFMGISTSDHEMSQLNLDGKVCHCLQSLSSLENGTPLTWGVYYRERKCAENCSKYNNNDRLTAFDPGQPG